MEIVSVVKLETETEVKRKSQKLWRRKENPLGHTNVAREGLPVRGVELQEVNKYRRS